MEPHKEQGFAPLFILLIVLLLVGGATFAFIELADPACQHNLNHCFNRGSEHLIDKAAESPKNTSINTQNAQAGKLTGSGKLRVDLSEFRPAKDNIIAVSFDQKIVSGDINITVQGDNISLSTSGSVDPDSGALTTTVSGKTTKNVSYGQRNGSVTTEYSGQFSGTINLINQASGNLSLTQKVIPSGNIPGYNTVKSETLNIPWTGYLDR